MVNLQPGDKIKYAYLWREDRTAVKIWKQATVIRGWGDGVLFEVVNETGFRSTQAIQNIRKV